MQPFETIYVDGHGRRLQWRRRTVGHPKVYLNFSAEGRVECPVLLAAFHYQSTKLAPRYTASPPRQRPRSLERDQATGHGSPQTLSKPHHVYLIDGSGYHLPRLSRAAAADARRRHADRRRARLRQHALEVAAGQPTPIISPSSSTPRATTLPQPHLRSVQGAPSRAAGRSHAAIQAGARRDRCLQCLPHRARGFRGRRSDRDLCARGRSRPAHSVTIVSSDKDLMQLVAERVSCGIRSSRSRSAPPR